MIAGNLSGNTNQVCFDFQTTPLPATPPPLPVARVSGSGNGFQSTVRMPGYTGAAQSPNAPQTSEPTFLGVVTLALEVPPRLPPMFQ
jgi:hypothetical protein